MIFSLYNQNPITFSLVAQTRDWKKKRNEVLNKMRIFEKLNELKMGKLQS